MLTGGLFRTVAYLALGIGCIVAFWRGADRWRVLAMAVFGVYAIEALTLTLFPLAIDGSYPGQPVGALVNLVPFRGLLDGDIATRQAVQNVLLGVPFGFGLWWVLPRPTNTKVILLGLAAFVAVEIIQLGTGVAGWSIARASDVNDLVLNMTGVLIGMAAFRLFAAAFRTVDDPSSNREGSLRLYIRVVLTIVSIVALAACSSDQTATAISEDYAEAYFEQLVFGVPPEVSNDLTTIYETRREEIIEDCMSARGLEYVPRAMDLVFEDHGVDLASREGRAEWGLGISTMPTLPPFARVSDPNVELYEELTDAAQAAWDDAFDSCDASAYDLVEEELGIPAAVDRARRAFAVIAEDPHVSTASEQWVACMADAGYDATDEEELATQLGLEFGRLAGDAAQVAEFQDRERIIAVTSWDCGVELRMARQQAVATTDDPPR